MSNIKKKIVLLFVFVFLFITVINPIGLTTNKVDYLGDITITLDIHKIRSLEHDDPQLNCKEEIDTTSDPDFYVSIQATSYTDDIAINQQFTSDIVWNTKYIYNEPYSISFYIPDHQDTVDLVIQLWDAADTENQDNRLCDISPDVGKTDDAYDVEITYHMKTGHWDGDDALQDASGYGRLNGCDDGTIYQCDRDCELWFSITQQDGDQDAIPYFTELKYGLNPMVNDGEDDPDEDGIPTWWELKYGYDPVTWDNHFEEDSDNDGLPTINEYRTTQWFSDPYTRDLFIELDQMDEGPNGEKKSVFPERAKELLYTAHDRQNVIYHLDDGSWGEESGSEYVPFDAVTDYYELQQLYQDYFLHGDENNWRKEIFHYGIVIYQSSRVAGMAFGSNRFQISSHLLDLKVEDHGFDRDVTYASCYMHETGHTLGFWPIPGHNQYGWLLRIFLPLYKSCMSYGWIYRMVDYSDGSRPFLGPFVGDYDDWERMDLTRFLNG